MGMAVRSAVRLRPACELEQVMRVSVVDGCRLVQYAHEILQQERFIVVDDHTHGRVRREDDHLPLTYAGFLDDSGHSVGYVHELDLRLRLELDPLSEYFHMVLFFT